MFEDVVGGSREGDGCHVPDEFDGFDGALERLLADPDGDVTRRRLGRRPDVLAARGVGRRRAGRAGARLRHVHPVRVVGAGPGLGHHRPGPAVRRHVDRGDGRVRPGGLVGGGAAGAAAGRAGPPPPHRPGAVLGAVGGGGQRVRPRRGRGGPAPGPRHRVCPDRVACRLLATLPDTFALWEAGRIDTAKARAIDEATVVLSDELARAVQDRVLPRARNRPWPSSRRRWPAR